MNPPRLGFSRPFRLATRPAAYRRRPDIALRDFVPTLLLRRCPDFINAAILATERPILVVTALDKIWNAATVVASQQGGRDRFSAYRAVYRSSIEAADLNLPFSTTEPVRLDLLTALLVALHGGPVVVTANPQPANSEMDDDFSSGKYENLADPSKQCAHVPNVRPEQPARHLQNPLASFHTGS